MTIHTNPTRRDLLRTGALSLAGLAGLGSTRIRAALLAGATRGLKVTRIDRTTAKLTYREVPERAMSREIPHWAYSEICEVHLQSGHVGFGESLLYYTWGATDDDAVKRAQGKNAVEIMWDDTLGAGLQMALFDAVAKACEVPVHSLLGKQVHKKTPLAWWNIDTSPEDMASECKEAYRQGYRAYKTKGRPWFDVWALIDTACKVVPKEFKITLDFNDTLLDAERGIPILKDLAKYPQIAIYETPIFQTDIKGNQAIRKAVKVPVAMHYATPPALVAIKEEICDGLIINGGAARIMERGHVSAMADMPFWLQMVGSGVTAAFSLHFGGVHSHATWPAVNCHQLFKETLLAEPIAVKEGYADVPDKPGLGFELDRDTLARLKVEKPRSRPEPDRLIRTTWPDGRVMYIANTGKVNFMLDYGRQGKIPYFERGVTTTLVPNDGSDKWRRLYEQARKGPVLMKE